MSVGAGSDLTWQLAGGIAYRIGPWDVGAFYRKINYRLKHQLTDLSFSGPMIGGIYYLSSIIARGACRRSEASPRGSLPESRRSRPAKPGPTVNPTAGGHEQSMARYGSERLISPAAL